MPDLVRKILIFAAVDGLIIQPLLQKGQRPASSSKISYKDTSISTVLKDEVPKDANFKSIEAFGIVGLLTVSKSSYLISITRRQQVAQILGKPIYVISEVTLTPLASRAEADASITQTITALQKREQCGHEFDSETESEAGEDNGPSDEVDDDETHSHSSTANPVPEGHIRSGSIAEDVIAKKGGYGRFAQKWFSKKGWTVDQKRNLGMTASESEHEGPPAEPSRPAPEAEKVEVIPDTSEEVGPRIQAQKANDVAANLLPKLLRTTQILFGASQSFFFSYDYDITRSFANKKPNVSELPLHTQVDPNYFWNRHIMQPFINAGQHAFVLPLLQGFVGQRTFEMDTAPPNPILGLDGAAKSSVEMTDFSIGGEIVKDDGPPQTSTSRNNTKVSFLLTLISRRSVERAGLRYLRRGVDDEGNTANGVETEQILSDLSWTPSNKVHSFVQIRGSIPVFFSQSPYSFKPVPQIQHSEETNHSAFLKHFKNIKERYGDVQVVSLVEKHGNEAIVGDEYEKHMKRLNESGGIDGSSVGFEWFDFHALCRGMKFENVSILMETLGTKLDSFGDTVEVNGQKTAQQCGVLRTNCMDCLDRTNVVQSACGRRALELQLKDEGIDMSVQVDQTTAWFNILWADNGDAISKQYASTAALKGDFTRERKRGYKGALTDMGLSISRFYSGIVNDYFSQAAIDFLLGNVTAAVFEEFEANLMSGDPGVSMAKMRQQAIETCQKLVIADQHEELIGGWTMLSPQATNTIKSMPFEESVLLLTDAALYSCKFDWNMEKVSSFEKVDLQHITNIKYGTYIISTLSPSQADEAVNVGFVVTYKAGSDDITRVNTRSMSSLESSSETETTAPSSSPSKLGIASFIATKSTAPPTKPSKVLAMKALPSRSAVSDGEDVRVSEFELVKTVCAEIERMILPGRVIEVGTERKGVVETGDIISLADAKRSTGLLEQWGHSIKKLVWA